MKNLNSDKTKKDLFLLIKKYNVKSVSDELLKTSIKLLLKMFSKSLDVETLKIITIASIWAWHFDDFVDDPQVSIKEKEEVFFLYQSLFNSSFFGEKVVLKKDYTAGVSMMEDVMALVLNNKLSHLEKDFLFDQYNKCIQGFYYDAINMGRDVDLEEAINQRAYSGVSGFLGALIYSCMFKIETEKELTKLNKYLFSLGKLTKLENDLITYPRERITKEVNVVLLLEKKYEKLDVAINKCKGLINTSKSEYLFSSKNVNEKFVKIIARYLEVYEKAYKIKDIRNMKENEA